MSDWKPSFLKYRLRVVFSAPQKANDGDFFRLKTVDYFLKKDSSRMFDSVLPIFASDNDSKSTVLPNFVF